MTNETIEIPEGILHCIGMQAMNYYKDSEDTNEKAFYLGISTVCATIIRDKDKPYIKMDYDYENNKRKFEEVLAKNKKQEKSKYHQIDIDELLGMLNELGVNVNTKKKKDNDEE